MDRKMVPFQGVNSPCLRVWGRHPFFQVQVFRMVFCLSQFSWKSNEILVWKLPTFRKVWKGWALHLFFPCRLESSLPLPLINPFAFATPLVSWLETQKLIQGSLWHPAPPRWLVLSAMTTSRLSKVWAKNSEWLQNQLFSWLQLLQLDSWLGQIANICQTPHLLEEFALWSLRLRIWSVLNELEPAWVCQPSQWNWPQAQLA